MARYYRRRSYTRVVKPKKKWGSNLKSFSLTSQPAAPKAFYIATLAENSSQTSNPTPIIVKCGNFKVQGDCWVALSGGGNAEVALYVMYLPEGVYPADTDTASALIQSHPEWILSWKYISNNLISQGSPNTGDNQTFTFSSRLKRNLNSGDKVCLMALIAGGVNITNAYVSGMCQFWTCAN